MNVLKKALIKILLVVLAVLFYSCGDENPEKLRIEEAVAFSDTLAISKIHHLTTEASFFNPVQIENIEDKYLLVSEFLKEDFFRVFELPEVHYLYAWGVNGRGPGEFQSIPMNLQVDGDTVIPYDGISRMLKYLTVNDSTLEYVGEKELRYEGQWEPLNRIVRMNDSLYFADHGSGMEDTNAEHIALHPDNKDSLFTFGKYPETELEGFERYSKFMKTVAAKPDGSKFAAFYLKYNLLRIYDLKGKLQYQVEVQDPYVKEEKEMRYRSITAASDSHIYALGFYEKYENIHEDRDTDLISSLEVWDWEGNMVYRASFDRLVHDFDISESNKKLYGVSSFSMSSIFEYDLSEILNQLN